MTLYAYSSATDHSTVLTLDAGGTNLKFSAVCGGEQLFDPVYTPTEADDLDRCLANIFAGFEQASQRCRDKPVAISFAFPGPADYPAGVIGEPPNLPAFRGGVPLGPMLEERFGLPVFINNDGDLFAYGEAMAGFLPYVNGLLAAAGSKKRFRNLFGLTLGTGLGAGLVSDGKLFLGDNSAGAEAWLLRNKLDPQLHAEEGVSIRAVRRSYAELSGLDPSRVPEVKEICGIGMGEHSGNREAAVEAFRRLGEVLGDVLAQALTLVDGLVVIGGGISAASPLFLPAVIDAMNDVYIERDKNGEKGVKLRRLIPTAYNLEDSVSRDEFLNCPERPLAIPGSARIVHYDPLPRTAVGICRMGTSRAVAIGAYAFALSKLDELRGI
jgi:glucokinase